jgi:HEAT repeat protein
MDKISELLRTGDLRTDGNADQVARLVLKDTNRLTELLPCLDHPDSVIRAHAAHAIEVMTRSVPELLVGETRRIILRAESDAYPIVRWHMVMALGHMAGELKDAIPATETLLGRLKDTSPLVRSWSVYSLVAVGRNHPEQAARIITALRNHGKDHSPAVRSRINRAITLLQFADLPLPDAWIKNN